MPCARDGPKLPAPALSHSDAHSDAVQCNTASYSPVDAEVQ